MKYFRALLVVCPLAVSLAQTQQVPPPPTTVPPPPPKTTPPPPPSQAKEVVKSVDFGQLMAEQAKQAPQVPPDKVVLTVGDTKVTAAQFDRLVGSLPEQYQTMARGAGRKQFADSVVQILVMAQEGQRRKLNETQDYKTLVAFQDANVLANLVVDDIRKSIKISDADLHKYYDDHKNEFEQVHARHILIRFQGSQVPVKPGQKDLTDDEALAKAKALRAQIAAGGDFAALAQKESDDTGSGMNGGDLGSFRHGQMVPQFEQAAFAMKPGELSEPVKSQFGYHIIKVESHESKSFDEVKGDIENRIKPDQTKKMMDELQQKATPVFDPQFFSLAPPVQPVPPAPGKEPGK